MTNTPKLDKDSPNPPPNIPVKPKRGAFPTPKSEIENAKPYIPGSIPADDGSELPPPPSTHVDD